MSKLIDTAVSHFNTKAIRKLYVEEWDVTVYTKNLSLDDKSKWMSRADGDTTDYLVYAIIFGTTNEKGESLFDIGDKVKLRRNADPEVVSKIASFILTPEADSEEGREKN
jgi:hypothetical protein